MTNWQPIETAPKDGTTIDLWIARRDGTRFRQTDCKWISKKHTLISPDVYGTAPESGWGYHGQDPGALHDTDWLWAEEWDFKATHWIPLPAPPTETLTDG